MSLFRWLLLAAATAAALPAQAYILTSSGGPATTTPGAVTFATFDGGTPVDPAYATVAGGTLNLGTPPGLGNWMAASTTSGPGVVVINLTGLADYFGLYWGTNDGPINEIRFFNGAALLGAVGGVGGAQAGFWAADGYWNITAGSGAEYFNRIELAAQGTYFEFDNLAIRAAAVPEPLTTVLLGIGLAALWWRHRGPLPGLRRARSARRPSR